MTAQDNTEIPTDLDPDFVEQSLPSVGELLSKERHSKGLTEKQIADELHITMHYVRAIESNSFEKLPGNVFAKGYIKSYALYLGMDIEPVLASYDAHVAKELDVAKEKTRIQVRRRKDKNRPWVIASAVLFLALFIGLWFANGSSDEPEPALVVEPVVNSSMVSSASSNAPNPTPVTATEIGDEASLSERPLDDTTGPIYPPLTEALQSEEEVEASPMSLQEIEETIAVSTNNSIAQQVVAPADPNSEVESEVTEVAEGDQIIYVEATGDDVLLISFSGESWVEISDDSQGQIYRDLLETGDVLEVKGTAPFNVLLGDAPFAELSLNGNTIDVSDDIRIDNSARFTVGLRQ